MGSCCIYVYTLCVVRVACWVSSCGLFRVVLCVVVFCVCFMWCVCFMVCSCYVVVVFCGIVCYFVLSHLVCLIVLLVVCVVCVVCGVRGVCVLCVVCVVAVVAIGCVVLCCFVLLLHCLLV